MGASMTIPSGTFSLVLAVGDRPRLGVAGGWLVGESDRADLDRWEMYPVCDEVLHVIGGGLDVSLAATGR